MRVRRRIAIGLLVALLTVASVTLVFVAGRLTIEHYVNSALDYQSTWGPRYFENVPEIEKLWGLDDEGRLIALLGQSDFLEKDGIKIAVFDMKTERIVWSMQCGGGGGQIAGLSISGDLAEPRVRGPIALEADCVAENELGRWWFRSHILTNVVPPGVGLREQSSWLLEMGLDIEQQREQATCSSGLISIAARASRAWFTWPCLGGEARVAQRNPRWGVCSVSLETASGQPKWELDPSDFRPNPQAPPAQLIWPMLSYLDADAETIIVRTDEVVNYDLVHHWLVDLSTREVTLLPWDERPDGRRADQRLAVPSKPSHAASDGRTLVFHENGDLHLGHPTGERVPLGVDSYGPFLCLPERRILYVSQSRELWIVGTGGQGNHRVLPPPE